MAENLPKPTIWVTIPPPLWALSLILAAWGLSRALALPVVFQSTVIGWIFFAIGFAVSASGRRAFAKADTEVMPASRRNSHLVVAGPFSMTRNPMYVGILIALFGLAVVLGTFAGFIAAIVFFIFVDRVSIPYEEKKMEAQFGEDYVAYQKRVRRWV